MNVYQPCHYGLSKCQDASLNPHQKISQQVEVQSMIFICVPPHVVFVGTKHGWINLSAPLAPRKKADLLLFFVVHACMFVFVRACACVVTR